MKLLVNIIENYREKMKFDAVLTRIFACREKLNELILSAQKNSLHVNMVLTHTPTHSLTRLLTHLLTHSLTQEIVEKPNPNDLFEVDL